MWKSGFDYYYVSSVHKKLKADLSMNCTASCRNQKGLREKLSEESDYCWESLINVSYIEKRLIRALSTEFSNELSERIILTHEFILQFLEEERIHTSG